MKSEESLRQELGTLLKNQADRVVKKTEEIVDDYISTRIRIQFLEQVLELNIVK